MTGHTDTSTALDALVSGKRRVPRIVSRLPVRVKGVHGEFEGMVHDISVDGALVRIPVAEIDGAPSGPIGPAAQFELLERHFRDSFDLCFIPSDVIVEAQVVRLLVSSDEDEVSAPELALGCRFVSPLTPRQQSQLDVFGDCPGLEPWGQAATRHDLCRAANPSKPVTAFLQDGAEDLAGPRFVGRVRAIGRAALTVRLPGATRSRARTQLGDGPFSVRIMRGSRELLAVDAQLVTARYSDQPTPGCEVLLATGKPLPRAVRRLFRAV
ncbi:MAG: PilZ domain-containing protein [Planctomycetota bacterium]|nr:PilZ domain-containing protein [Planctomycetota bacterium]